MSCKFGNDRCLCQFCVDNAAYPECKKGYCIYCFECEEAGKSVHDVFLCTGYERWPEEADKQLAQLLAVQQEAPEGEPPRIRATMKEGDGEDG